MNGCNVLLRLLRVRSLQLELKFFALKSKVIHVVINREQVVWRVFHVRFTVIIFSGFVVFYIVLGAEDDIIFPF